MKDDHLQGILFTSSARVQVLTPTASQRLVGRAKSLADHFALRSRVLKLTSTWREDEREARDTELGNFIDHSELGDLLNRFRR